MMKRPQIFDADGANRKSGENHQRSVRILRSRVDFGWCCNDHLPWQTCAHSSIRRLPNNNSNNNNNNDPRVGMVSFSLTTSLLVTLAVNHIKSVRAGGGGWGGGGMSIMNSGGGGCGGGCGGCGGGCGGMSGGMGGWGGGMGGGGFMGALGDPHLTAIDGTGFDFMQIGTFNLLKTNGLQVHAFMDKCSLPDFPNGTCTYGIGVGFGDSVARFFVENNQTVMTRGTNDLTALTLGVAHGATDGYRVFVASDPKTFVDVTLGSFTRGNSSAPGFLDLSLSLSAKFRQDASGVLSAGGKKSSDELAKENKLLDDKSLLTCENESCKDFIDGKALNADMKQKSASLLRDGYDLKSAKDVPLQKIDVAKIHHAAVRMSNAALKSNPSKSSLDKTRVAKLCNKVIKSITMCESFVKSQAFYIHEVCVKDTMASGVVDTIDHAKLAYLRQCRRQVDAALSKKNGTTEDGASAAQTRKSLNLANADKCPKSCSSRGKCLVNGCRCHKGWSGISCELELSL